MSGIATRVFTAALTVTVLASPLLTATTASAESETHLDKREDVSYGGEAVDSPGSDILRLITSHADGVVALRLDLAQLDESAGMSVIFRVRTSEHGDYWLSTGYDEGGGIRETLHDRRGDRVVRCDVTTRFREAAGRVTVLIPRPCLGRPQSVRTGARTTVGGRSDTPARDDARRKSITTWLIRTGPELVVG